MSPADVATRIAKLHSKAESAKGLGNLAEAEAFAAKVSELLARHKLSLTDIEFAALEEDEPIQEQSVRGEDFGQDTKCRRSLWQETLAGKIARANGCRILVTQGLNRVIFVGRESDRAVAVHLFCTLVPELDRISKREHRKAKKEETLRVRNGWLPRGWRQSWLLGAVDGIASKMRESRKVVEDEARAQGKAGALVRLTGTAVGEWVNERYKGTISSMYGTREGSSAAYNQGHAHGRNTSLRRGVDGGSPAGQIGSPTP